MSPYEISMVGGSVGHYNEEPGYLWAQRLLDHSKGVTAKGSSLTNGKGVKLDKRQRGQA